jgi:hypothetical protein
MKFLRQLLKEDLWQHDNINQTFDSAETSLNQIPSTFKVVNGMNGWVPGTINADIGGGKEFSVDGAVTHKFTVALKSVGVTNIVYDPFNRTTAHNTAAAQTIRDGKADTATVNNVLNVIQEPTIRARVIMQAHNAVKDGGTAYFLIYQGDKSGQGRDTKKGRWQNNMAANEYVGEVSRFFSHVTKKGNLIIGRK